MSLLFPDQYRIGLGSSYAVLAKVQGRKVEHLQMQSWDYTDSTAPWRRPLAAVASWLAQIKSRANVTVTLSADLAPMQLLPWREDVTNSEQQVLLAKVFYRNIYGDSADSWKIIVQPIGYGQSWLASGVDSQFLSALSQQLEGVSITSVMPLPASILNMVGTKLPKTANWLLVPELNLITILYLFDGRLDLLKTLPVNSLHHEAITDILLREMQLAGLKKMPVQIYTSSARTDLSSAIILDAGWQPSNAIQVGTPLHLLGGAL